MYPRSRSLDRPVYDKLVPKKNAKSMTWNFFGLPATESGTIVSENIVICNLCDFPVSSKGGSTSNLLSHLKGYHPTEYSSINVKGTKKSFFTSTPSAGSSVTPTIQSVINENIDAPSPPFQENPPICIDSTGTALVDTMSQPQHPYKKQKTMLDFQPITGISEKLCTDSVAKFIAETMQPYSIVETQPFINMVKILNPKYKLPGRKYFSNSAIPKLYNDLKGKIKKDLSIMKSSEISITTDCWTSLNSVPYIAITAHYVDKNWNLKSPCLSCAHFDVNHTSDNINEVLKEQLLDWDIIIHEINCCTTDNGSNILKAISALNIQHMPCFGHTINIGVNRALQNSLLQKAVVRVKKLQNTIAHSWKMSRDFKNAQELLQIKVRKLPSACPTRWWSTSKLCMRFLENQLPLCKLLADYPAKKHLMLEGNEVTALEDFVNATSLMEDIVKNLSGQHYTTASSVLPLLLKIKKNLQGQNEKTFVRKIKADILSALEERYFDNEQLMDLLRLSTVCDPRFRLAFVDDKEKAKQLIIQKLEDMYEQNNVPAGNSSKGRNMKKTGLEKLLCEDNEDEENDLQLHIPSKKAENELQSYLAMVKIGLNEDPLAWWKLHEASFPALKIIAKKYLAVQGTSVPSERVFSSGGLVITKNRASLLPKNAEMQVFLTQNRNFY